MTITDEHIGTVEEFAQQVRSQLATADFALQRRIVEALNIYVTLRVEDGQKVIDLHWYAQTERLCLDAGSDNNPPHRGQGGLCMTSGISGNHGPSKTAHRTPPVL